MTFEEVSSIDFFSFIENKNLKTKNVQAGEAAITVYYSEDVYDPSKREAYIVNASGVTAYHIRVS